MRVSQRKARRVANVMQYATYAAVVWGLVYPRPYDLAMLVVGAIPLIAIGLAATGDGAYTLEGRRDDKRGNLVPGLILPGLVLMYRGTSDQQILDWPPVLWLTGLVSVGWLAALILASPEYRLRKWGLALIAPMMCAYGFGASTLIDARLDIHAPVDFTTRVLGKHSSGVRSRTYYLDVAAWGPRPEHGDVEVTRRFYDRAGEGSTVCVYLWPGALGARWFQVGDCPVE